MTDLVIAKGRRGSIVIDAESLGVDGRDYYEMATIEYEHKYGETPRSLSHIAFTGHMDLQEFIDFLEGKS